MLTQSYFWYVTVREETDLMSENKFSRYEILRCVDTMLSGRMQHTAALPRGKSCSAYAANAIASPWKKNFLQTFLGLFQCIIPNISKTQIFGAI